MKESYSICFTSHDEVMFRDMHYARPDIDKLGADVEAVENALKNGASLKDVEDLLRVSLDGYDEFATMYHLALLDVDSLDTSRQFARHAHGITVGLSLRGGFGRMNEYKSHHRNHGHRHCKHTDGGQ